MAMILDGTNGAFLPTWTTGTRPASPANGQIGYNSTTGQIDQYVGSAWSSVPTAGASQATATALGTVYGSTLNTSVTTAIGYQSAASSTSNGTTSIGYQALYNQTTSSTVNTAVGYQAGFSLTTGSGSNVFVGATAGYYVTGTNNTALGYACLANNNSGATGSYNTAVGSLSLAANTTSSYLTAVGYQAAYNNTGPTGTFIGAQAGVNILGNGGGNSGTNTAVGYQALKGSATVANNTAYSNTAIGATTLEVITSGYNNVMVGYGCGNNITTGITNICIGSTAIPSTASAQYQIVMGNNVTGKGDATAYIYPSGGPSYQGNNSATWSVTSDQRLKKNIVDNTIGLEQINGIRIRNFEYRLPQEVDSELKETDAIKKEGVQLGVIAQELQQVLPDCVRTESTGVMSVDSENITWHLINAVKELSAKVTALEARLGA